MNMPGEPPIPKDAEVPARPQAKAPYSKPTLETYGPVAELTRGGKGSKGDGPMSTKMCDARAKQDIVCVGMHALGIGVYAYRYKQEFRARWGQGLQFGLLAQEVEVVLPAAVTVHQDGYRRVDYAKLARAAR